MISDPQYTEDEIYGGRLRIRQPARGYRVNIDTILLAAAAAGTPVKAGARLIELGCGVGAAALIAACNKDGARVTGLERDPGFAELARENAVANQLQDRVEIIEADALAPPDLGQFDLVFFNPPYDRAEQGRAPTVARRPAHIEERPIEDWIKVWSNRMAAGASMSLIHRADRLPDILAALDGRLGGIEIFPVRPFAGAPARRVIVRAWKGSRAPLKLFAGLDLHPGDGAKDKYTPETEAILRGEAFLRWP